MHWSSRIYDDKDCKVLRPNSSVETVVPYILATDVNTTDASTAIDLQIPNAESGGSMTMYGLVKVVEGRLYIALYPTASTRPKALERGRSQIFAPL